ncbi:MAG TPA: alkaline phosphatase family protein [Pyrinomonadaceae bacterium]|nr:alkaline phosphatase family protein [Pyrinomonadaceae bacterium]
MRHVWGEARVLAVGLDAAEPALVRELVERGEMPALRSLSDGGAWARVVSPAHVGSGAVWPTFLTGEGPAAHGVYGEWAWRPEAMGLTRYHGRALRPFWKGLAEEGLTVGVLDVPFAPLVGLSQGFEISEWGAHDVLEGRTEFGPADLSELLTKEFAPHPLSLDRLDAAGPEDREALQRVRRGCAEGARLRGELGARLLGERRPQLAVVVFPEIHHAAHYLWHGVGPEHGFYGGGARRGSQGFEGALAEVCREVDAAVARLVEAAGPGAAVLVFSLHGMRPTRGIPNFLGPLLCERGFARLAGWRSLSWRGRAVSALAAAKRLAPAPLKKLYYKSLPQTATQRLARPTMMPAYDWSRTRAFALPTDQHGWVRVNLKGREAEGVVPAAEYESVCAEVEGTLRGLLTRDGRRVVRDVLRTAGGVGEALGSLLPDLVVHWDDAAFDTPLRLRGARLEAPPTGMKFTGQHAPEGFCVARGVAGLAGGSVRAEELHRLIVETLRAQPSRAAAAGGSPARQGGVSGR